jgi:hypothetical protein
MTIKGLFPASRPSLDLNFAKTKRLDPRITFSRSSTATYIGSDGLIKSAAVNEARFDHSPSTGESLGLLVEEARTNLLTYSSDYTNAAWTKQNVSLTPNSSVAPDGTLTATLVANDATNGEHRLYRNEGTTSTTRSIYAKAGTAGYISISRGTVAGGYAVFDLLTGVVSASASLTSAAITAAGNGWYRCQVIGGVSEDIFVVNVGTTAANAVPQQTYAGTGQHVLLWGAQKEAGAFPTSYIPTPATFTGRTSTATFYNASGVVQTAASGVARSAAFFPDSNGVMRSAGLLLEAAGTNLLLQSETFGTTWTTSPATISANVATAPDGTTTADKLVTSNTTAQQRTLQNATVSAGTVTFSVYAKAAGFSYMRLESGASLEIANFDLTQGVLGTVSGAATITRLSNGWYRCTMPITASAGSPDFRIYVIGSATDARGSTLAGNGVDGIFLWGAQVEQGSYATSYIPTVATTVTRSADTSTSATVTRSADVAQITGTNFSSWFNQNESTVLSLVRNVPFGGGFWYFGPTGAPRWWTRYELGNGVRTQAYDGLAGGPTVDIVVSGAGTNITLPLIKHAVAISNTLQQHAGSANGSAVVTGAWDNITGVSTLALGIRTDTGSYLNGTISRLTYYPSRLPDATLQALTAS